MWEINNSTIFIEWMPQKTVPHKLLAGHCKVIHLSVNSSYSVFLAKRVNSLKCYEKRRWQIKVGKHLYLCTHH